MTGVSILIPTYNRKNIVLQTVHRLQHFLRFDQHIQIIVSADGDDGTYEEVASESAMYDKSVSLVAMCGPRLLSGGKVTGLGANLNQMLRAAAYPIIMQMDDDHWLNAPLDINQHVAALGSCVSWIRFMGVAAHRYRATMIEQYWHVDWESPELYIPSNRPHLKHKAFHDFFGLYPEGLSLGGTEETFCHQCKNKARAAADQDKIPHVCVPVSLHEEIWSHVGDSWQARGE